MSKSSKEHSIDPRNTSPVPEDKGRRSFLDLVLTVSGLGVIGSLFYPLFRYLTPPPEEETLVASVNLGPESDFPANFGKIFRFGSKPGIIIRGPDGKFHSFIAICTHLSCIVQYDSKAQNIWCACHNGRFNLNGINISGPPPRPLIPLKVNVLPDSREVVVTLSERGVG
ncbi:MAG: ubiquinol-cytochrome c reductase iron-sulfur subunit [bacterium]